MFIFERERERMQAMEGQRERETESEAGSRLWAVSTEPDAGLEPTNRDIMTWAKVGHSSDWATQVPPGELFKRRTELSPWGQRHSSFCWPWRSRPQAGHTRCSFKTRGLSPQNCDELNSVNSGQLGRFKEGSEPRRTSRSADTFLTDF